MALMTTKKPKSSRRAARPLRKKHRERSLGAWEAFEAEGYKDAISLMHYFAVNSGRTRAGMRRALDRIASLCVGAVSDLDADGRWDSAPDDGE